MNLVFFPLGLSALLFFCFYPLPVRPFCQEGMCPIANCTIAIYYPGGKNTTMAAFEAMKAHMSRPWSDDPNAELIVGFYIAAAIEKSPIYSENLQDASLVFVLRSSAMAYVGMHPGRYTLGDFKHSYPFQVYAGLLNSFLAEDWYHARRGVGVVLPVGHVLGEIPHVPNGFAPSLILATDPAVATPHILVPYANLLRRLPKTDNLLEGEGEADVDFLIPTEKNVSESLIAGVPVPIRVRKYFLVFQGNANGPQRQRLLKELHSLPDYMKRIVHWNDPNIDHSSSKRFNWMSESTYCLDPTGHVHSTRREWEPLMSGCIPVMMTNYDYAFHRCLGPYSQWAVMIPQQFGFREMMNYLLKIPLEKYLRLQRNAVDVRLNFAYNFQEFPFGYAGENIICELCQARGSYVDDLALVKVKNSINSNSAAHQ